MNDISYGTFKQQVIGYASSIFAPMYQRVFQHHWNTQEHSRMRRSYYYSNFKTGYMEMYVPTFENLETNMDYHKIIIQTVSELNHLIFEQTTTRLYHQKPKVCHGRGPAGKIDSTTIIVASPRLQTRGFIRAKYDKSRHLMMNPIICGTPEIIFKRLLTFLPKFYMSRIVALIKAFKINFYQKLSDWGGRLRVNTTLLYIINNLIDRIDSGLAESLRSMLHIYNWLQLKYRHIINALAKGTMIMRAFREIKRLQPLIKEIESIYSPLQLDVEPPILTQLIQYRGGG